MPFKALLVSTSLVCVLGLVPGVPAQAQTAAALSGQVSSAGEGVMEGVLVSAKKEGSTITVTVVTDEKGQYSFPAGRLDAGHYAITIRAAGYDLDGPRVVDIAAGGSQANIKLVKTKKLANQLSNAEWLISAPGPDNLKANMTNCVSCHTLQRIFTSTHDADEFKQIFKRMGTYSPGSTPTHPQPLLPGPRGDRSPMPAVSVGSDVGVARERQPERDRQRCPSSCRRCRVPRARRRRSSTPNTTCRAKKRSRTT